MKKNLRDYDIVHYAGHADARNPSDSGWLLSDGMLKAAEIAAMGGLQPMPSLVFSNACQSGHTDGWRGDDQEQQIFRLANAFLLSGVQHYIGTFWETVDETGAHFAKRFYTAVAAGKTIGTALRDARQAPTGAGVSENRGWAGNYMLYGEPSRGFDAGEMTAQGMFPERNLGQWKRTFQAGLLSAKTRTSPLFQSVIGALLLIVVYVAYSEYYSVPSAAISPSSVRSDTQSAISIRRLLRRLPPPRLSLSV